MKPKITIIFVALATIHAVSAEYWQPELVTLAAGKPNEIEQTIDFLKRGAHELKINDEYRDVIMMVGNTGTGKSTLTQFVAGNLADLISVGKTSFVIRSRHEGVIGNSTTESQTIFPGLMIDETKTAFYDCPGYDDTRNMSVEVASTYFVKKVVDHAKSLKIVLVVNIDSVHPAGSRRDFPSLVEHFRKFLHNVALYSDSISLVATKVNNEYVKVNKALVLQSDEEVIETIVEFLETYRNRLQGEEKSDFNIYALELLRILLQKNQDGQTYKRIGIFRKPDEAGPLNEIDIMVEGRAKIREIILNRTTYGNKIDEYFGYTISETSRLKLIDLTHAVNEEIRENVEKISSEFEKNFRDEERKLGNLGALTERFERSYNLLTALNGKSNKLNASLLVTELINVANTLSISISHEFLDEILNLAKYVGFVQEFSEDRLPLNPNDWMVGLKNCTVYLNRTKNWFKFLYEFHSRYSQYEHRLKLSQYNVSNIDDWGSDGKPQGIHINSDNFQKFVKKQENPALISDLEPTEFQLNVLNNLLDITIKRVPIMTCETDSNTLLVKGDYVRTSEINTKQCDEPLERIHIFALHTVFIDSSIDAFNRTLNVSIIAPKWYIFGDQTLNLSGANNSFTYAKASNSSSVPNVAAEPGAPGQAGRNAGNFVGLGKTFINGEKLQIFAIGGAGSPGQNGGNGLVATDPDVKNIDTGSTTGKVELDQKKYRAIDNNTPKEPCYTISSGHGMWQTLTEYCSGHYVVHSNCGSSSGDGGKGGEGGRTGILKIFELGSKSSINLKLANGESGAPGTAGKAGKNPQKVGLRYSYRYMGFTTTASWKETSREEDNSCTAIKPASNGGNDKNIPKADTPGYYEAAIPLNEFQSFVRESQINALRRDDLNQFINLIHESDSVLANYSTKGFVDELLTLEREFYKLHSDIDMSSYYLSISKRLERYANQSNADQSKVPQEQLKVFSYLYAAAFSKYVTLKSTDSLMIIDVDGYLSSTINEIQNYEVSSRANIINEKRKSYRSGFESKINEATAFIQSDIIPAITNISKSIDGNLNALVNEAVAKKKQAAKDELDYYRQQEKLQKQMALRFLFGTLDIAGQFGACLGPYGMAAGAIAGGVSQIGQGFMDQGGVKKVMVLPEGVKSTLDNINKALKKRKEEGIDALEDQIKNIQNELDKHKPTLNDLNSKIDVIRKDLETEKNKENNNQSTIKTYEDELGKLLKSKSEALGKEKTKLNDEEKKALKTVEKLSSYVDVFKKSMEVFKKFAEDEEKLEEVRQAFNKSSKILDEMREYEQKIYNQMWPMVNDMRKQIDDVERGLSGQSQASLQLKKWKIQSTIRDTKFTLKKFTKGFEIQEDVVQVIQKLDEALETLINVYDRIESFYDQEKLGDYIAAIGSAGASTINVSDPVLENSLLQLDLMISSNVVLNNYEMATDAFKQAVFPFAAFYFEQFRLPKDLQLVNTTSILVEAAVTNLKKLRTRIDEYNNTVINGNDKYIISMPFSDELQSSFPFFEWKSEKFHSSFVDLFSHKNVSLNADIKEGLQLNAVKFNVIELRFKAHESAQQQELDSILNGFVVYLTHTGNSYYRCGASYYVIDGTSQEMMFGFEKKDGIPVHQSTAYQKIKGGTVILSPYTMWNLRLQNIGKDTNAFDKLLAFANHVDLLLIGHGQYVRNDAPVCGQSLDEYYPVEKTVATATLQSVLYKLN